MYSCVHGSYIASNELPELRRVSYTVNTPLMGQKLTSRGKTCRGCCRCARCFGSFARFFAYYVATTTNLPWEIAEYIAGISMNVKGNGTETIDYIARLRSLLIYAEKDTKKEMLQMHRICLSLCDSDTLAYWIGCPEYYLFSPRSHR